MAPEISEPNFQNQTTSCNVYLRCFLEDINSDLEACILWNNLCTVKICISPIVHKKLTGFFMMARQDFQGIENAEKKAGGVREKQDM